MKNQDHSTPRHIKIPFPFESQHWFRSSTSCFSVVAIVTGILLTFTTYSDTANATEVDVLIQEAMRLSEEKLYDRAELVAQKALEIALTEKEQSTLHIALINQILFGVYSFTDRPARATEIATRNLEFVKQAARYDKYCKIVLSKGPAAFRKDGIYGPPSDLKVADWCALPNAMQTLAMAYIDEENGLAAEPLARESLVLSRALFGIRSEEAAMANSALADAYIQQKKPTLALPALEQAASIYEDIGAYEDAADVLSDMASLLSKCGETDRAEKFEYRAKIVRKTGSVIRWVNAFPFGFKGLTAVTLFIMAACFWCYRRIRKKRLDTSPA